MQEADESDRKWQHVEQFESSDSNLTSDLQPAELHQRMRRTSFQYDRHPVAATPQDILQLRAQVDVADVVQHQ